MISRSGDPKHERMTMANARQLESEITQALRGTRTVTGYAGFERWSDVVDSARRGDDLWYRGAMDRQPSRVRVVKVFKNGGIRIDPLSNQADNFTASADHLGHFFRRA
jgi:hypothetical protein